MNQRLLTTFLCFAIATGAFAQVAGLTLSFHTLEPKAWGRVTEATLFQDADNAYLRIATDVDAGLWFSAFDPPNGAQVMKVGRIPAGTQTFVVAVPKGALPKSEGLTVLLFPNGERLDAQRTGIFLRGDAIPLARAPEVPADLKALALAPPDPAPSSVPAPVPTKTDAEPSPERQPLPGPLVPPGAVRLAAEFPVTYPSFARLGFETSGQKLYFTTTGFIPSSLDAYVYDDHDQSTKALYHVDYEGGGNGIDHTISASDDGTDVYLLYWQQVKRSLQLVRVRDGQVTVVSVPTPEDSRNTYDYYGPRKIFVLGDRILCVYTFFSRSSKEGGFAWDYKAAVYDRDLKLIATQNLPQFVGQGKFEQFEFDLKAGRPRLGLGFFWGSTNLKSSKIEKVLAWDGKTFVASTAAWTPTPTFVTYPDAGNLFPFESEQIQLFRGTLYRLVFGHDQQQTSGGLYLLPAKPRN